MPHDAGGALWRRMSLLGTVPIMILLTIKTFWEHQREHEHHVRPAFVPYEHLRIRNKRFPWGDGQRSLFHNPHTNALPTGYED